MPGLTFQEPVGRNSPSAFTLCHRAEVAPPRSFALRASGPEERVDMTVLDQNEAKGSGVRRFQIRAYDKKTGSPAAIDGFRNTRNLN